MHDQPIFALDISPKGNKIVSGGADNSINSYKSIVESIQNNEATIEPTTMNKPVGEISALSLLLSGSQATNSNEIYQMKRNTIIQSKTAQIPITGIVAQVFSGS